MIRSGSCADAGTEARIGERVRPGLRRDLEHLLEGADPSPGAGSGAARPKTATATSPGTAPATSWLMTRCRSRQRGPAGRPRSRADGIDGQLPRGRVRTPGPPRGTAATAERLARLQRRAGLKVWRPTSSSSSRSSGAASRAAGEVAVDLAAVAPADVVEPEASIRPGTRRRPRHRDDRTPGQARRQVRRTAGRRPGRRRLRELVHAASRPLGAEDRAPCPRSPVAPRDPRRHQPARAARPAPCSRGATSSGSSAPLENLTGAGRRRSASPLGPADGPLEGLSAACEQPTRPSVVRQAVLANMPASASRIRRWSC